MFEPGCAARTLSVSPVAIVHAVNVAPGAVTNPVTVSSARGIILFSLRRRCRLRLVPRRALFCGGACDSCKLASVARFACRGALARKFQLPRVVRGVLGVRPRAARISVARLALPGACRMIVGEVEA